MMPSSSSPDHPEEPNPARPSSLNRRALLTLGALAGLAGGASYYLRQNSFGPPVVQEPDPLPLPPETDSYREFLTAHPLRYLTPAEIIRPHLKMREGVTCGLPPRAYWTRLLPALQAADEIRDRLGVPLKLIVSAYRSPAYNAKCPGAVKYSQHTRNRALDLVYDCPSKDAFETALVLRQEGFFSGGLGLYPSFIHLDTRGTNATWG